MDNKLLVLGCSQAKVDHGNQLPAIEVYDGPYYRVLRKFLREYQWPQNLSISTLSAKHGLFGVIKEIDNYDQRMNRASASGLAPECAATLKKWAPSHNSVHLALGREYTPAINPALESADLEPDYFEGGIGFKQSRLKNFLHQQPLERRQVRQPERALGRIKYFMPDWDDLLDPDFDFGQDEFSGPDRTSRRDKHCHVLMQPTQLCDGVLVSLAQRQTSKGPLRKLEGTETNSLTPTPLRKHYGLTDTQYLLGDCGAFSYINESEPAVSTEQAACLYDLYNFDLGASVDHIPIEALPEEERQARVELTCLNAERFWSTCRERGMPFTPVGSVQGTSPSQYAENIGIYYDMGYRHLAIGGLVPMGDAAIIQVVEAVSKAVGRLRHKPWVHLFGIFRPRLQPRFRGLGVDSFDSASYFRKAWLRSDQNYLSRDGKWYAAIRVPMTSDARTRKRLAESNSDIRSLEQEEKNTLDLLNQFDQGLVGIDAVLDTVVEYDSHLRRSSDTRLIREKYRRTLEDKPWLNCECAFCQQLGIHIVVFRGANRNKRRGAHNTAMLYRETIG